MRRTRFDEAICPIARTSDLIGDWWTPLVMREALSGTRRFEKFQEHLDIPRASLTARLDRLVDEGLLRREQYQANPPRDEYRVTRKGAEFYSVLAAMWRWGSDWLFEGDGAGASGGAPTLRLVDRTTGAEVVPLVVDQTTGDPIDVRRISVELRDAAAAGSVSGSAAGPEDVR